MKFKKYNSDVTAHLQKKYSEFNEFKFADICAVELSKGTCPTSVYLNNYKTFMVHGGEKPRSSEIFTEVIAYMREL